MQGGSRHRLAAAAGGLLAAATGVAVAELIAETTRPEAGPLVAVGAAVIDATPTPVKEYAVRTFGTYDKPLLLGGICVLLAVFAAILGLLARRRLGLALAGAGLFGLVGAAAALTRPAAHPADPVPALVGALVVAAVLIALRRAAGAPASPAGPAVGAPVSPAVGVSASPAGPAVGAAAGTDDDSAATAAGPGGMRPAAGDGGAGAGGWGRPAGRRAVLAVAASAAATTLLAGGGAAVTRRARTRQAAQARGDVALPPPADPAPPLPPGTAAGFHTANRDFYRVDTALTVPRLDVDGWRLRVAGMVDRPFTVDFADLLARPLVERDITLTCVSNSVGGPYLGTARWLGVPLAPLLREAGVRAGADQVVARSTDGMTIGTPVETIMDGRDAMLAVGMNGEPLPLEHGFPVRMLVPGLYGYVSACKWIVDLELSTFDSFDPYWVRRGWAARAPVKTGSRIDRPTPFAGLTPGPVPVAGVAWAQHRGISAVEVQVDEEPWRAATLLPVPSSDTWVQWLLRWPASPGAHTLRVRARDGNGDLQTARRAEPFPDGASGWHTVAVSVAPS